MLSGAPGGGGDPLKERRLGVPGVFIERLPCAALEGYTRQGQLPVQLCPHHYTLFLFTYNLHNAGIILTQI